VRISKKNAYERKERNKKSQSTNGGGITTFLFFSPFFCLKQNHLNKQEEKKIDFR
jgi:hypothetical protein